MGEAFRTLAGRAAFARSAQDLEVEKCVPSSMENVFNCRSVRLHPVNTASNCWDCCGANAGMQTHPKSLPKSRQGWREVCSLQPQLLCQPVEVHLLPESAESARQHLGTDYILHLCRCPGDATGNAKFPTPQANACDHDCFPHNSELHIHVSFIE